MRLRIRHETIYRYARPVQFLEHRLLLSPRPRHDITVLSTRLSIAPGATLDWREDVLDNLVATATFDAAASSLSILAEHDVEHRAAAYPLFRIAPAAHRYPFSYSCEDEALLAPGLMTPGPQTGDPVEAWTDSFLGTAPSDTLQLLNALNAAIGGAIAYRVREEEGTQSPPQTLALASGSCRDIAALFVAVARRLGFAVRAVSGYLFDPGMAAGDVGATHAWAEIFLPEAGWVAFDPTQQRIGSAGLVATACGVDSASIVPIIGGFLGDRSDFLEMHADVTVARCP